MSPSDATTARGRAARCAVIAKAVEEYRHRSGLYSCVIRDAATSVLNPRSFVLQTLDNGDLRISLYVGEDPLADGSERALAEGGFVGHERTITSGDMRLVSFTGIGELLDHLMVVMGADDDYEVVCDTVDNTE